MWGAWACGDGLSYVYEFIRFFIKFSLVSFILPSIFFYFENSSLHMNFNETLRSTRLTSSNQNRYKWASRECRIKLFYLIQTMHLWRCLLVNAGKHKRTKKWPTKLITEEIPKWVPKRKLIEGLLPQIFGIKIYRKKWSKRC